MLLEGVPYLRNHDTFLAAFLKNGANGELFVIAKSGKPMVTVSVSMPPHDPVKRIGFLKGGIVVQVDVDAMGGDEMQAMFHGAK